MHYFKLFQYHTRLFFAIVFLATGCADTKIVDSYNSNIQEFNKFSEQDNIIDEDNTQLELIDIEPPCTPASFKLKDTNLTILSEVISRLYNIHINPTSGIDDKHFTLSVNVKDICLNQLLDYLTEVHNVGYIKTPYGYNLYAPQLKTKIFSVDYHNFYRNASSVMSISNSQLSRGSRDVQSINGRNFNNSNFSSIISTYQEYFWDNIERTLRMIIMNNDTPSENANKLLKAEMNLEQSQGQPTDKLKNINGSIAVYRESGLVLVKGYPQELHNVEKFLNQVNKNSLRQVVIEAKILEVELSDQFSNGVQWELLTKNIGLALNPESIKQTSSPISSNASLPSSDNLVSTVVRGELTSKSGFGAVMQALSSQGKISVLSSPRVSALNNQRALIKFGDDKFFVTNVTNTSLSNSNNNSGAVSGFDLEPFFSGIALDATPNIVNDREVVMHIHPMISRVEEEIKRIKIDNKDTSIPIATIQTREADTVVKAHSGDIIILGGMMQNLVNLNDSNIPFANLGFLSKILKPFLSSQRSSKRQELIILLKPTIIHTTKKSSEISFDKYLIP